MKKIQLFLLLIIIFFGLTPLFPVHAFETRGGDDITVPKDTIVKGSLFAGGKIITIDGTVNGDLFCGGTNVTVNGVVTGDVICAGQTITINGVVSGNVRSVGQLIDVAGTVKRNVTSAGQTITVEPTADITGEIIAAGQTIRLDSVVAGDVTVFSEAVSLGDKAHIAGNLTYTSPNTLTQASGAAVLGNVTHHVPEKVQSQKPAFRTPGFLTPKPWPQNTLAPMIFYLFLGLLVILIAPKKTKEIVLLMQEKPVMTGMVGFLVLIFVPMAAILLAITLIGIPVSFLLGMVFVLAVLISRIWVALVVGEKLLLALGQKKTSLLAQMAAGVVVVEIIVKMPFLGLLVGFIALLWGLGGFVMSFRK